MLCECPSVDGCENNCQLQCSSSAAAEMRSVVSALVETCAEFNFEKNEEEAREGRPVDFLSFPCPERKKENRQPKGGMGGRHAATTQGF